MLSIVGNRADADDVVQEVCALLWQKYGEFDCERNFRKWACGFAFRVARAFVRRKRRRLGYGLSDEALAKVSAVQAAGTELFELRREVLDECLAKLPTKDHSFLMGCYGRRSSLVEYAKSQGIPIATVYTRLKRLRQALVNCINRSLGRELEF